MRDDRRDFNFTRLCLVGRVEKLRDRKYFCLLEIKNQRIKNRVCINLLIYPYLKIMPIFFFFFKANNQPKKKKKRGNHPNLFR